VKFRPGVSIISVAAMLLAPLYAVQPASAQLIGASTSSAGPAIAPPDDACARLAEVKMKGLRITSATSLAEGVAVPSAGLSAMFGNAPTVAKGLPAFCRVAGHIAGEAGSDIGFEVWMPASNWDGRLHGVGIGGFAGVIDYQTLGQALKGGQAGVATDTGHSGTMMDSAWAKGHPERVRDYGWRAIHLSTVAAKKLIATFYGRGPDKSYFVGCSGGGRQGLMEAARFPEDYDGVVAGAPAAVWTDLAIAMINPLQAQLAPGAAIRANQAAFLQSEVLKQCDGADGQVDGLVADARLCRFDAARLGCDQTDAPQCFSPPQIAALRRIHAGPHDRAGRQLVGGYLPSGSEVGTPSPALGWEGYILGRSGGAMLVSGLLANLSQKPLAAPADFDFDRDPALLKASLAADLDAPADLKAFFARGGKLILWHGWADAAIPPQNTIAYRDAVLRQSGARAAASVQLFMVPGVQHCMGGAGPDAFGQLNAPKRDESPERSMVAALQAWVEGKHPAPQSLIGRRGHGGLMGIAERMPERQRLLCAWPKKAVLRGGGDPELAASYACANETE
jgi:pimeloyl-ACP methyl ester carboxylesterase